MSRCPRHRGHSQRICFLWDTSTDGITGVLDLETNRNQGLLFMGLLAASSICTKSTRVGQAESCRRNLSGIRRIVPVGGNAASVCTPPEKMRASVSDGMDKSLDSPGAVSSGGGTGVARLTRNDVPQWVGTSHGRRRSFGLVCFWLRNF
jgi:hypothetical protein